MNAFTTVWNYFTSSNEKCKKNDNPNLKVSVENINKRTLGKLILKVVGNEGTEDNTENAFLRRQVQTCISNLEHHKPDIWKNASVTFFGMYGEEYVIESGNGLHRFIVFLDSKDEIQFKKRK